MKLRLLSVALVLSVASLAVSQQPVENPFKNAKVGDFVAYKMTTKFMDKSFDVDVKQTVTAKDDKTATLKATTVVAGTEKSQDSTVDLTKPYDFTASVTQAGKKGKFDKTGEGKEKITVGGKTYDCKYIEGNVTAEAGQIKIDSKVKVWISSEVPLSGMVKMEMKSDLANMQMEITGSGSK